VGLMATLISISLLLWSDQTTSERYSCDDLAAKWESDFNYNFTATASSENAKIVRYTFDFGDGNQTHSVVSRTITTATHSYDNPGIYTVRVTVYTKVGEELKPVTSQNCEVTLVVE